LQGQSSSVDNQIARLHQPQHQSSMPRLKPHMLRRNKLEFDSAARQLTRELVSEQVEYLLLHVILPELLISNSISAMADQRHVM
jgi:hypothetical protein